MTTSILRYQAKPERAEENQELIEAVFAELDGGELDGFTYKVFRLEPAYPAYQRPDQSLAARP